MTLALKRHMNDSRDRPELRRVGRHTTGKHRIKKGRIRSMPRRRRVEEVKYRWLTSAARQSMTSVNTTQDGKLVASIVLPDSGRVERIVGQYTAVGATCSVALYTALLAKVSDDSIGNGEFEEAFDNPSSQYTNRSDDFPLFVPQVLGISSSTIWHRHVVNFDMRSKRRYDTGSSFHIGYCWDASGSDSSCVIHLDAFVRVLVSY